MLLPNWMSWMDGINKEHWLVSRAIAHRGYHNGKQVPENSFASFQAAIDRGLPIELDVQLMGGDVSCFSR